MRHHPLGVQIFQAFNLVQDSLKDFLIRLIV